MVAWLDMKLRVAVYFQTMGADSSQRVECVRGKSRSQIVVDEVTNPSLRFLGLVASSTTNQLT